jgi:SEC-C motif domain protein
MRLQAYPDPGMKTPSSKQATSPCPCGSLRAYGDCCGRFHAGAPAPDAEALMRSRYCAYVLLDGDYLLATWHARTRPASLDLAAGHRTKWLGLEVRRHVTTGDDSAVVEFIARFKLGWRTRKLHETSRFLRENNRWYYVDGDVPDIDGAG